MTILSQPIGKKRIVSKVDGNDSIKLKIQDMGIVVGNDIVILSYIGDSIIVLVKESKIALSKEVASRISVDYCDFHEKGDEDNEYSRQSNSQHKRCRKENRRRASH
ncbi:MAG: FeoA family protein [Candidatus Izemoplasmatales bacterium]|nr:FeoA family protein [Candidatus Izemoplasmatales bacterium]